MCACTCRCPCTRWKRWSGTFQRCCPRPGRHDRCGASAPGTPRPPRCCGLTHRFRWVLLARLSSLTVVRAFNPLLPNALALSLSFPIPPCLAGFPSPNIDPCMTGGLSSRAAAEAVLAPAQLRRCAEPPVRLIVMVVVVPMACRGLRWSCCSGSGQWHRSWDRQTLQPGRPPGGSGRCCRSWEASATWQHCRLQHLTLTGSQAN